MTVTAVGFSGPTFVQTPGNGVATTYNFPFLITAPTDLAVGFIVSGAYISQSSGYTINAVYPGSGQVVFSIPPPIGTLVDLRSVIPETQPTNFSNLGGYFPESTTNAVDRVTRNIADLYRLTYQFGIHGPDNESISWPSLPPPAQRLGMGLVFDSIAGLPAVGTLTTVPVTTALITSLLGLGQTPAEAAAGVTPVNLQYLPLNVQRYGAALTYNSGVNDLPFFQSAHAVALAAGGGVITGAQRAYQINGTWAINAPVTVDFGNAVLSHVIGTGAILFSNTNARIVTIDAATFGSRPAFRNINIMGTVGVGANQNGLSIGHGGANTPVDIENVGIWNCGNHGLSVEFSVISSFRNVYAQGCAGVGIINSANSGGANKWYNCAAVANHIGMDLGGTGADTYYGIVSEQNAFGIVFESGAIGHIMYGVHTEANVINSLLFAAGSNRNRVDFETWGGGAEPAPSNIGGAQNRWSGTGNNAILYDDKCVQRVSTLQSSVVTTAALTAVPYSAATPTTATGMLAMSQAITPQAAGNLLVIRAWGFFEMSVLTSVGTVFLTETGSSNAIYAQAISGAANKPMQFDFEWQVAASSTSAVTFSVFVGSDGVAATGTFGGSGGAVKYGGIGIGGISVEEFRPSSG